MNVDVFAGMNDAQREAIAHLAGPLLVVAGAGSGKTRVITHRIANLIQHGTRADRILAITFTNKAAGEMQERVQRLLGLKTPWITTFHSAGLRILKLEQARLGFAHPFTVLDEDDQKRLFKQVYKDLRLDPKMVDPRKLLHRISQWKNQLINISKVEAVDDSDIWAMKCHARYAELCQEQCCVDFDDLLVRPVRLFEADEALRVRYSERFPHILIDEYQDTNTAQYRLVRLLGSHGNICATGDPDQAIYGWRGADIENILNFERDFPGCKVVLLEQNYRSTKVILRAAQGVVSNNTRRKAKTIFSANAEGKPITVLAVDDEMDESWAIAAAVERMHREGRKLAEFAVFYRTNAQSRILEDGLRRRGVAYRIVGGTRFYDRREVKDLLAYLKLLINPSDRVAIERIANVPKRSMGEKTMEALITLAQDEELGVYEILERDDLLERIAVGRNAAPLKQFARIFRMIRKLPPQNPEACVRGVIELTNLEAHYRDEEDEGEGSHERIANIREVITAAEQFHEASPDGGLGGFLELVALVTDSDAGRQQEKNRDQVTLMTLHAAKGLEFPVVFVTGCEDGVLPLKRMGDVADLEEERRLMYVGITRAMTELYLSRARCRMQYGQTNRNELSQFLGEIPSDCFEAKDATGRRELPPIEPKRSWADDRFGPRAGRGRELLDQALAAGALTKGSALSKGAAKLPAQLPAHKSAADPDAHILRDDPFQPGERVLHSLFGEGAVVRCKGPRDARAIVIAFDRHGEKELQLAFCAGKLSRA